MKMKSYTTKKIGSVVLAAVLGLVILLSLGACELMGRSSHLLLEGEADLVGPTWRLTSIDGTAVEDPRWERTDQPPPPFYSIAFTDSTLHESEDGYRYASVWGYPNEGISTYQASEENGDRSPLSIHFRAATRVNTPPDSREEEFFKALKNAETYETGDERLRIYYDDGKVLEFEEFESED